MLQTAAIITVARMVGVKVIDHVIVTRRAIVSMQEQGVIHEADDETWGYVR